MACACGASVEQGAKFCDSCGEAVVADRTTAAPGALPPFTSHVVTDHQPTQPEMDMSSLFATSSSPPFGSAGDIAKQVALIDPAAIRALMANDWVNAELNWFLPSTLQDRVARVLRAKVDTADTIVLRDGRLMVASSNKPPTLTSALDAMRAMDNLLRIRSTLMPVTADCNTATWLKFRELFADHAWMDVVRAFEQVRLSCSIQRVADWSAIDCESLLRSLAASRSAVAAPAAAVAAPAARSASNSNSSSNSSNKRRIDLPLKDYRVLLALCEEKGLCLKFQHDACDLESDHTGRKHACSSCGSAAHGSAQCRSAKASVSDASGHKKRRTH